MKLSDFSLLLKKILVTLFLILVPVLIISATLLLLQHFRPEIALKKADTTEKKPALVQQ
jgi:hypothetical protein